MHEMTDASISYGYKDYLRRVAEIITRAFQQVGHFAFRSELRRRHAS
jgi:hypothetical protein